jgi:hypothetical protein
MKRRHYVSIISFVVAAGLLGAGALVVGQSHVPAQNHRVPGDKYTGAFGARVATAGGSHVSKKS